MARFPAVLLALLFATPSAAQTTRPAQVRTSVSQHGITWTFDRPMATGRFVTGDWWVLGPVRIVRITPASRDESGRVRNGSMVNPSPRVGSSQGFDSAMYSRYAEDHYKPKLNRAYGVSAERPLRLRPGSSLVSTISVEKAGARPQLQAAAILTVLAKRPPVDAFRPPYCGGNRNKKAKHRFGQLDVTRLLTLKHTANTPAPAKLANAFERPWLDHIPGWLGQEYSHPVENMPNYGRDVARTVGEAALCLHMDFPLEQKKKLLIGFVQLGIDLFGILEAGGETNWSANGGHASGRKWPILFAGILLGDAHMSGIGFRDDLCFGEDQQTFHVLRGKDSKINGGHGNYLAGHVGMAEWGIRHATKPQMDDVSWDAKYRKCCTANAWNGYVLAARLMGARSLWNHDALFDYVDRYIRVCREKSRPNWEISASRFTLEAWDTYRYGAAGSVPKNR